MRPPTSSALRPSAAPKAEQRITLFNIRWEHYEFMLQMMEEHRGLRLTYLDGTLELTKPSVRHELIKTLIARLLEVYALEHDVELIGAGSATFKKRSARRGAEPDECYFLGRERSTPDLAIEVVITKGIVDKLDVYSGLGVKELWIWEAGALHIYRLRRGRYTRSARSGLLPELDLAHLSRFIERPDQTRAVREYRDSLRRQH
jgi:Uma2 family endonuclease